MIKTERVTLFGQIINSPAYELFPSTDPNQDSSSAMKVDGKLVKGIDKTLKVLYSELQQQRQLNEDDVSNNINGTVRKDSINTIDKHVKSDTRIWLANKLKGELITEVSINDMIYIMIHMLSNVRIHLHTFCNAHRTIQLDEIQ